jgi:hypothetical protein
VTQKSHVLADREEYGNPSNRLRTTLVAAVLADPPDVVVTDGTQAKHISSILARLGLPPDARTHRRVQAILT